MSRLSGFSGRAIPADRSIGQEHRPRASARRRRSARIVASFGQPLRRILVRDLGPATESYVRDAPKLQVSTLEASKVDQ